MAAQITLVHTTTNGIRVYVRPGRKAQSEYDFIVGYCHTNGTTEEPRHIDIVEALYQQRATNTQATDVFISHVIDVIINGVKNVTPFISFPPRLHIFSQNHVTQFRAIGLDGVGKYDLELLLILVELIIIQEYTNYPNSWLTARFYRNLSNHAEVGVIVNDALWGKPQYEKDQWIKRLRGY